MDEMRIPGFIDLQVNGYKGADFSSLSLTADDFEHACLQLFDAGTAAFLPTIITTSEQVYRRNLPLIASAIQKDQYSKIAPGIHLEGPFISPEPGARGAHDKQYTRPVDIQFFEELLKLAEGKVRMLTIAAELDGAVELAAMAVEKGITVALGHQMASAADIRKLAAAGATVLTHLGNGMPKNVPRHENPLWAGLAEDRLSATLITDGHHLPADLIKTFIRAKTVTRTAVISDSSPLAGSPPGTYKSLGNHVILEPAGKLYNPHTGFMVGSSATILQCMNHLARLDLLTLEELLQLGFHNPLKLANLTVSEIPAANRITFDTKQKEFSVTKD